MDFASAAIRIPAAAQPNAASAAISGTSSIPQLGCDPNTIATSMGTQP